MNRYNIGIALGLAAASLTFLYREKTHIVSSLTHNLTPHYSGKDSSQLPSLLPKFPFDPSYLKNYPSVGNSASRPIDNLLEDIVNKRYTEREENQIRNQIYIAFLNGNNDEARKIADLYKQSEWYEQEFQRAQMRIYDFLDLIKKYESKSFNKGMYAKEIIDFLIEKGDINNPRIPELLSSISGFIGTDRGTKLGNLKFSGLEQLTASDSAEVHQKVKQIKNQFLASRENYEILELEFISTMNKFNEEVDKKWG